jgi:hypothetical protein
MAITNAITDSFKLDLLFARHNFNSSGGNTFKLALYTSSATLGAATTAYSSTNEITGGTAVGYTAAGATLVNQTPTFQGGTTACADFSDVTYSTSTITANGALLYNDTASTPVADASVASLTFGGDKTSTAGDFIIAFPAVAAATAIIRIA